MPKGGFQEKADLGRSYAVHDSSNLGIMLTYIYECNGRRLSTEQRARILDPTNIREDQLRFIGQQEFDYLSGSINALRLKSKSIVTSVFPQQSYLTCPVNQVGNITSTRYKEVYWYVDGLHIYAYRQPTATPLDATTPQDIRCYKMCNCLFGVNAQAVFRDNSQSKFMDHGLKVDTNNPIVNVLINRKTHTDERMMLSVFKKQIEIIYRQCPDKQYCIDYHLPVQDYLYYAFCLLLEDKMTWECFAEFHRELLLRGALIANLYYSVLDNINISSPYEVLFPGFKEFIVTADDDKRSQILNTELAFIKIIYESIKNGKELSYLLLENIIPILTNTKMNKSMADSWQGILSCVDQQQLTISSLIPLANEVMVNRKFKGISHKQTCVFYTIKEKMIAVKAVKRNVDLNYLFYLPPVVLYFNRGKDRVFYTDPFYYDGIDFDIEFRNLIRAQYNLMRNKKLIEQVDRNTAIARQEYDKKKYAIQNTVHATNLTRPVKGQEQSISKFMKNVKSGKVNNIEKMLASSIELTECYDSKGYTPLMYAAQWGKLAVAKLLLQYVDVNQLSKDPKSKHGKYTALSIALMQSQSQMVKLLLDNDADLSLCINDGTPILHKIISTQHRSESDKLQTLCILTDYYDACVNKQFIVRAVELAQKLEYHTIIDFLQQWQVKLLNDDEGILLDSISSTAAQQHRLKLSA